MTFGRTSRILGGLALTTLVACGGLLGLSDYEVGPDCTDESGFFGKGCRTCPPRTESDLLNSCGRCFEYDNAQKLGKPGAPEACDAGTPDTGDSGGVDVGVDAEVPPACSLEKDPIYVTGSSALNLVLPDIANGLGTQATIIYQQAQSCIGAEAIAKDKPMTGIAAVLRPPISDLKAAPKCTLDPAGVRVDIGLSDVPQDLCDDPVIDTSHFVDEQGPIQVFMFAVPRVDAAEKAISAETAARVFGQGAAGAVAPYDRCDLIIRRTKDSGTQRVLATFLGLNPDLTAGISVSSSSGVVAKLATANPPEKAICITSSDVAEDDLNLTGKAPADVMRPLAFQHFGQECAFLPDKLLDNHDKFNVRTGRYVLWAPVHMLRRATESRAVVRDIMNFIAGRGDLGTLQVRDTITIAKKGRLVPQCAMQVTRDFGKGIASPMRPFEPEVPCGCAYELAKPVADSTCVECKADTECPASAPRCLFGACERAL